jgi:hypothetical protein
MNANLRQISAFRIKLAEKLHSLSIFIKERLFVIECSDPICFAQTKHDYS